MRLIDQEYTRRPFYGSRRMVDYLREQGYCVNRKRVRRLMRLMGIEAIYPKPNLSKRDLEHRIYPYLLRNQRILRVDQVWSTDITYIRMASGFMYLVAIMDWYSRHVLTWELSNTLDVTFCLDALDRALTMGKPEIFNSDQGSQFTSLQFTRRLQAQNILISMDGKGRATDNAFIERLWRSLKYEDIYLKEYQTVPALIKGLEAWFSFYNKERFHQALDGRKPYDVYYENQGN